MRSTGPFICCCCWIFFPLLSVQACRRQAPAWLVSSLLSVFPESAHMTTQFGELPLHLAVESGAAPEVVNLVVVANWSAIVTPDQSGRVPTEILDRNELLQLDDHRIVHESLMRCYNAYVEMQRTAQDEQAAIKRKHKLTFTAVTKRHQEELKREQDKQDEIKEEVRVLESKILDMQEVDRAKEHHIKKFQQEKEIWMAQISQLEEIVNNLKQSLKEEHSTVQSLHRTIEDKDREIARRDAKIATLSNDLSTIAVMHDDEVMDSLITTEQSMRAMVSSQIALQKLLTGQANGLKALLATRGIPLPEDKPIDEAAADQEEKMGYTEDTMDAAEATSAVVAAAVAALKPVPSA